MIREVKESDCADIAKIYNGYVAITAARDGYCSYFVHSLLCILDAYFCKTGCLTIFRLAEGDKKVSRITSGYLRKKIV